MRRNPDHPRPTGWRQKLCQRTAFSISSIPLIPSPLFPFIFAPKMMMKEHRSREHRPLSLSVPANSRVCSRLNARPFIHFRAERHLLPPQPSSRAPIIMMLLAALLVFLKKRSATPHFPSPRFDLYCCCRCCWTSVIENCKVWVSGRLWRLDRSKRWRCVGIGKSRKYAYDLEELYYWCNALFMLSKFFIFV